MSRTPERLNDASVLLTRARAESEATTAGLLCGCASLLLVIALEEEISLIIRSRTEENRRGGGDPGTLREGSNWNALKKKEVSPLQRVEETPLRLSGGRLGLRKGSAYVLALREVLALRNHLLHNTPDTIFELDLETGEWIQSGASGGGIALDGSFTPGQRRGSLPVLPWAKDPWREVSAPSVERFSDAVRRYIEELKELDLADEGVYPGGEVIGPVTA